MKKIFISTCTIAALSLSLNADAQNLINSIEKGIRTVDNVSKNAKNKTERNRAKQEKINPKSTEKSSDHLTKQGEIKFMLSKSNANNAQYVNKIDLNRPAYYHVYLEDPIHTLKSRINNLNEFSTITSYVKKNYYINGQLIATYSDELDPNVHKNNDMLTEVIVPADGYEFDDNKMRIGVFAHVFSSLPAGTHKLKLEYVIVKNTKKKNVQDPYEGEYDNEDIVIASGEVDVQIESNALNNYAKKYGRPKFSKGILEGDATLEKQIKDIIKREHNREPIYMYASDSWTILRGALDRITGRESRIYYIFKNSNGRCELADFMIYQAYEGNKYGNPRYTVNKYAPAFKFVVCQNY